MKTRPIFLGIDPGSRVIGFAALSPLKLSPRGMNDWRLIDVGVLRVDLKLTSCERLFAIHEAIYDLVLEISPSQVVIEKAFHGVNAQSSLRMGEARGAIIAAIGRCGLATVEYAPTEIKQTIGGSGQASKEQVANAITTLLGFKRGKLPLDATDALAIAMTGALNSKIIFGETKIEF
ncbi:MAG: crossover junction endodeoxyribonuclease RuvC [Proteobacteria bacterium]|nr:crossover junction endodeoxyribonuclease RuvC [Pseudomonadota bacterium]